MLVCRYTEDRVLLRGAALIRDSTDFVPPRLLPRPSQTECVAASYLQVALAGPRCNFNPMGSGHMNTASVIACGFTGGRRV